MCLASVFFSIVPGPPEESEADEETHLEGDEHGETRWSEISLPGMVTSEFEG